MISRTRTQTPTHIHTQRHRHRHRHTHTDRERGGKMRKKETHAHREARRHTQSQTDTQTLTHAYTYTYIHTDTKDTQACKRALLHTLPCHLPQNDLQIWPCVSLIDPAHARSNSRRALKPSKSADLLTSVCVCVSVQRVVVPPCPGSHPVSVVQTGQWG